LVPQEAVSESAYRRIRTDIIFGRLAPGKRLRLEQLKSDYEVSVSTLREILNRLASEGLVVAEGQKGFNVAPVSAENLKEIAALRELLECYALEQSFAAGDLNWEARVVAAHYKLAQMEAKMLAGDKSVTEQWKRFDWEFHQALISACLRLSSPATPTDQRAVGADRGLRPRPSRTSRPSSRTGTRRCSSRAPSSRRSPAAISKCRSPRRRNWRRSSRVVDLHRRLPARDAEHQKKVFASGFMEPDEEEGRGRARREAAHGHVSRPPPAQPAHRQGDQDARRLAGIKLRMPGTDAWQFLGSALGANPVPVAFTEVYTGLQTGAIDGQDNPLPTVRDSKFYEVTKQIVLTSHLVDLNYLAFSKKVWDGLTPSSRRRAEGGRRCGRGGRQKQLALEDRTRAVLQGPGAEGLRAGRRGVPHAGAEGLSRIRLRQGLAGGHGRPDQRARVDRQAAACKAAIAGCGMGRRQRGGGAARRHVRVLHPADRSRYVFNTRSAGRSRLCLTLWLWLVFWTAAFCLEDRDHVRFDLLYLAATKAAAHLRAVSAVAIVRRPPRRAAGHLDYITFYKIKKSATLRIRSTSSSASTASSPSRHRALRLRAGGASRGAIRPTTDPRARRPMSLAFAACLSRCSLLAGHRRAHRAVDDRRRDRLSGVKGQDLGLAAEQMIQGLYDSFIIWRCRCSSSPPTS
jgi:DNA-binding transcriptional regulator YhcF (GntR family)